MLGMRRERTEGLAWTSSRLAGGVADSLMHPQLERCHPAGRGWAPLADLRVNPPFPFERSEESRQAPDPGQARPGCLAENHGAPEGSKCGWGSAPAGAEWERPTLHPKWSPGLRRHLLQLRRWHCGLPASPLRRGWQLLEGLQWKPKSFRLWLSGKSTVRQFSLPSTGIASPDLVGSRTRPKFLLGPHRRGHCQSHLRVRDPCEERPVDQWEVKGIY